MTRTATRGVTLIELVVAMAIFAVISSVAIGAYVSVTRLKSLTNSMRESQQKIRIAEEIVTRLARQANIIIIKDSGTTLELYFDIKGAPTASRFMIKNDESGMKKLYYNDSCLSGLSLDNLSCPTSSWSTEQNLFTNDITLNTGSGFSKIGDRGVPELELTLNGRYGAATISPYFRDDFSLSTKVVLENIR